MKLIIYIVEIFMILTISIQSRSLNSNKGTCSISTISIPTGSNYPVMIYNARVDNENWRLTVLDKDHSDKFTVEGNLFYTDKKSGESWYTEKSLDENNFEAMRDAFSLCRILNTDNKETKIYEKSRIYSNYRTSSLPSNMTYRKDSSNLRKSFLQVKMKLQMRSRNEVIDDNIENELENLDKDESPDLVAEQYQNLNNDAFDLNKELEHQLNVDNGNFHHSADLILD